jgi:site-specific recombinase XerD
MRAAIVKFLAFAAAQPYNPRKKTGPPPDHPVLSDELLAEYFDFCRSHKGLKDITIRARRIQLWRLRVFLQQRGKRKIQDITTADLDAFFLHRGTEAGGYTPHGVPESIRPFFRYLYLKGILRSNLSEGLFSPCRFRMDRRPKYIPWPNVQKLLASIDRSTPIGKRDYAILALLAYHGLRAREAAHLKLADIDWDAPSLWLYHRKNGANARIPLSAIAKEALQDYLAARPSSPPHLEVFLTCQAPIVPLGGRLGAVAQRHLFRLFGRSIPKHGAYVLRHSFAKSLLDRGAKLQDIAALLGHRKLDSTLTYTQIDTEGLREVADNYANLLIPPEHQDGAS